MNIKIEDIKKEVEDEKRNVQKDKKNIENIVRPNTIAGKMFRTCVKDRLECNWIRKKEENGRRIKHLKTKLSKKVGPEIQDVPETFHGVKLLDKDLENIEDTNKANVHENIDFSDQERNAVNVIPKDTFFNNIYVNEAEQQTEVAFAKMRWNEKQKKEKDNEENKNVYDVNTLVINL